MTDPRYMCAWFFLLVKVPGVWSENNTVSACPLFGGDAVSVELLCPNGMIQNILCSNYRSNDSLCSGSPCSWFDNYVLGTNCERHMYCSVKMEYYPPGCPCAIVQYMCHGPPSTSSTTTTVENSATTEAMTTAVTTPNNATETNYTRIPSTSTQAPTTTHYKVALGVGIGMGGLVAVGVLVAVVRVLRRILERNEENKTNRKRSPRQENGELSDKKRKPTVVIRALSRNPADDGSDVIKEVD